MKLCKHAPAFDSVCQSSVFNAVNIGQFQAVLLFKHADVTKSAISSFEVRLSRKIELLAGC